MSLDKVGAVQKIIEEKESIKPSFSYEQIKL